jgi:hypothetical protein
MHNESNSAPPPDKTLVSDAIPTSSNAKKKASQNSNVKKTSTTKKPAKKKPDKDIKRKAAVGCLIDVMKKHDWGVVTIKESANQRECCHG